mmetsp:Transcript_14999/g.21965  ORF Transcript_14999/g.21965 Transcript_14999/m.21965 type:complete len:290 (+) Transcript_14999:66-935(+)
MASQDTNEGLQLVPETILKRKHDMDDMKAHRAAQLITNPRGNRRIFSSKTAVVKVFKPETILASARSKRNHAIRYKRVMKKGMQKRASKSKLERTKVVIPDGLATKEEEEEMKREVSFAANSVGAAMVFVIRIREPNGMPNNVKRTLNKMKLKSQNEGIFMRYDESSKKMLHLIEPWVTYGVPSKVVISDLIRRRGHGKLDGKRIPLSDNTIIEKALSEKTDGSVICIDDMVHELHAVSGQFRRVNSFLWTFHLSAPRTKFQKTKLNFKDGGDYGDRGEEIDDLIRTML